MNAKVKVFHIIIITYFFIIIIAVVVVADINDTVKRINATLGRIGIFRIADVNSEKFFLYASPIVNSNKYSCN